MGDTSTLSADTEQGAYVPTRGTNLTGAGTVTLLGLVESLGHPHLPSPGVCQELHTGGKYVYRPE